MRTLRLRLSQTRLGWSRGQVPTDAASAAVDAMDQCLAFGFTRERIGAEVRAIGLTSELHLIGDA